MSSVDRPAICRVRRGTTLKGIADDLGISRGTLSDQRSQYTSKDFTKLCKGLAVVQCGVR
jgi:FixJ family two-component response regulator